MKIFYMQIVHMSICTRGLDRKNIFYTISRQLFLYFFGENNLFLEFFDNNYRINADHAKGVVEDSGNR
jgi:hypothetical protein